MEKLTTQEIIAKLSDYYNLFNKLNNITYHNLQKTKIIVQEINKNGLNSIKAINDTKIHIYTLHLTLEEMNVLINNYMEKKSE